MMTGLIKVLVSESLLKRLVGSRRLVNIAPVLWSAPLCRDIRGFQSLEAVGHAGAVACYTGFGHATEELKLKGVFFARAEERKPKSHAEEVVTKALYPTKVLGYGHGASLNQPSGTTAGAEDAFVEAV